MKKDWSDTSSTVLWTDYNELTNHVAVNFVGNKKYHYFHVPKEVYEELLAADSVGKFLNTRIKNVYEYERIS